MTTVSGLVDPVAESRAPPVAIELSQPWPERPVLPHGQAAEVDPSPAQYGVPGCAPSTLTRPTTEVADCPSGFVTVRLAGPVAAVGDTETCSVTCVGESNVTEFTVTSGFDTVACRRLKPGSVS
jgi:hypothetical protein